MYNLEDVSKLPDGFDGQVRLFPLPNLVVFPHAMQPLHLFEPRYVQMLKESLSGDGLIAMATLTPVAGASLTSERPPISSNVCIGRILTHSEVEEDRHNILLVGIRRAKLIAEIDQGKPYRLGQVQVIEDEEVPLLDGKADVLKKQLLDAFGSVMPVEKSTQQNLHKLMSDQMGLAPITDIVSYTLPFAIEDKLSLLAESDVAARAELLINRLNSGAVDFQGNLASDPEPTGQQFPPPFSTN